MACLLAFEPEGKQLAEIEVSQERCLWACSAGQQCCAQPAAKSGLHSGACDSVACDSVVLSASVLPAGP